MTSIHSLRKPSGDSEPFRRSHLQGRGDRMEWPNICTNTMKLKRNIIFKTVPWLKARKSNRSLPFARQNQPQTCQLRMAKRAEVPPWKKSPRLSMKRYKNGTTLHADIFCHHENCENNRSVLHQ